jgi:hypothetical protein
MTPLKHYRVYFSRAVLGVTAATLLCAANDAEPSSVARKVMQNFAKCLVNRAGYRMRAALDLPVGVPKTQSVLSALSDPGCLAVASENSSADELHLRFKSLLLRGSIYDVLYVHDLAAKPALTSFDGVVSPRYPFATAPMSVEAVDYHVAISIGECVVRAQSVLARQLIMSAVESADEAIAVKALVPFLGPCLDQGQTIKLSKSVIRSMIAEPLYRLTKAAESPHA